MGRYQTSTVELDRAEQRWWTENGDLEEEYCWVQTPVLQQFLRRPYLRAITDRAKAGATVLELGCGTGWLSLLLAQLGCPKVVGLDFSPDQIRRARRAARTAGVESQVRFVVSGEDEDPVSASFDIVVMHAFLHHLAVTEVHQVLSVAEARLAENGTLIVVEPLHYAHGSTVEPPTLRVLRKLESLPRALEHHHLRSMHAAEIEVRRRLASRAVGQEPFGPSPKELPFSPEELRGVLERRFVIVENRPAICMSHLVAQDMLIAGLSQARFWSLARWPVLAAARALDRRLIRDRKRLPSTVWVFETFICRKRAA